jgi:hypothetical protein
MWSPSPGGLSGSCAEDLILLGEKYGKDPRDVVAAPDLVLRKLGSQPLALNEIGVAPEGDELVQRAELRRPRALERAVLLAARGTPDLRIELEVLALLPREQRVGAQLVNHGWLLR